MKLLKLTMLAATTTLAASAFIGASSASAVGTHPWTALCDAQELLLCPTANLIKHSLLGRARLLTGPSEFNGGSVVFKCTSGEGESTEPGVESQQKQNPETAATVPTEAFKANLGTLTFAGCTGCTGFTFTTPQPVVLWMGTALGNDWWLTANSTRFKLTGCTFGSTCTYEGNLKFKLQMDAEGAFFDPEGAELKRIEGSALCAEKGKWESGRTRLDWKLDDAKSSVHQKVWPSLLEELTKHEGTEL
jgi:hypothetical protein